jgi:predicted dehydrogenase
MSRAGGVIGLGIVGCGGAALDVVAAVGRIDGARIAATHDLRADLAADLAAPAGATVHASLEALLHDPAVHAVYVALPHDLLAPTATRAIEAGRPVLVEKPMATDLAGIEALAARARGAGLPLGVLFELRETGPTRLAARLVREGAIGDITAIRVRTLIDKPQSYWTSGITGRWSSPWRASRARAGGGVVLMNSIHQLDLVHAVTGLIVTRARGAIGTLMTDASHMDVEDSAAAVLRYDNGAIGSLVAAAHSPGASDAETIELDGRAGAIRMPDPYVPGDLQLFLRRPHGDLAAGAWISLPAAPADPFRDALTGFLDAVREGRPAPVGPDEAAAAMAVVQAIYADNATHPSDRRLP